MKFLQHHMPLLLLISSLTFFLFRLQIFFDGGEEQMESLERSTLIQELELSFTDVELSSNLAKMGQVQMGKLQDVFFTIYNVGGAELVIEDIEGDCFCTVPVWEDIEVAPGDSTRFSVRITK
jgi:hypothetical protein